MSQSKWPFHILIINNQSIVGQSLDFAVSLEVTAISIYIGAYILFWVCIYKPNYQRVSRIEV